MTKHRKYTACISLSIALLFLSLSSSVTAQNAELAEWVTMSTKEFVNNYKELANSQDQKERAEFAWRLFIRVNQPVEVPNSEKHWAQWET